ncbi:hypothetical protein KIJ04_08155 [Leuconostoc gelidum subsp. gelidum]|uniref:hypothetical protein n=1 Tax=Leuconostoc gelidum TaxID=1244 RepID=UPI001CC4DE52|nr:hypothetical protein [Leuconostoc gelidum]MBZ6014706.1 hypothetical protein [Leuconostoc gelidum subsp. gelidum]
MATEALKKLDEVLSDKTSLKDVNDDVQVLLEYAKSMTDYIERINDNEFAANRDFIKSEYMSDEITKSTTAIIMLNEYLDKAVALLAKAQR